MVKLKPLGIAVWGLGNHAWKNILPAIVTSTAVKLIGVYTRNITSAKQATDQFGGKVFITPQDMLMDKTVDMVYLATPTGLHFEHGMQVLKANKHLLCEKSLTHCSEKSQELIAYASKNQLVLLEAFMYLYHPQFLTAFDLVMRPEFGKILNISSNFGIPDLPKTSFRTSKELGGGAFLDVACYPISVVQYLVKELPKLLQFTREVDNNNDIDIAGTATLEFPSGIHAFLNWGYNRAYRADLMVWGEKQSLYMERAFSKPASYEAEILLSDKHGDSTSIPIKQANSFVNMLESFHLAVVSQEERERLIGITMQQAKVMGLFQAMQGQS
jgi:predicted dehydrogenase